jgi:SAM-dependent methyltransferase
MEEKSIELSDVFEDLVDWPKRLAGEEPFFRRFFESVGAGSVLDVACGTGQHAALFHSWGMRVEGADISPRMIERACASFGEPDGLRWAVRGYDEPVRPPEAFDAALCVGNSLALAPDRATVRRAAASMVGAVRKGGAIAVHLLNLWRFPEGPVLWQKCRRSSRPEGEALIVKGVHRCGPHAYVELLLAPIAAPESMRTTHLTLICLEAAELEEMFRESGATAVELSGHYDGRPYEREKSVDMVMTVRT